MSAEGVTDKGQDQLRVLLDALLSPRSTPVAISDGASPELQAAVADRSTVWCPVVRGTTVWAVAHLDAAVVESPNWLGRVEVVPDALKSVLVMPEPTATPTGGPGATIIRVGGNWRLEGSKPQAAFSLDYRSRTAAARRLAKQLNQVPGVRLAHGEPDSPTFILLVPDVAAVTGWTVVDGGQVVVEPVTVPGLPGALRITVLAAVDDAVSADLVAHMSRPRVEHNGRVRA